MEWLVFKSGQTIMLPVSIYDPNWNVLDINKWDLTMSVKRADDRKIDNSNAILVLKAQINFDPINQKDVRCFYSTKYLQPWTYESDIKCVYKDTGQAMTTSTFSFVVQRNVTA